ncbi:hypothetical protein [Streptomyces sp. TRM75563]|uniref:hypothetical protein n=1 Tax=Streptomyces sp. TRM75563 TaxID=2817418 RepID=UPI001F60A33F|nr:hypothetical protein [Streptomyces sp. TRM75563]MCI4043494.1 hypothetical protein [Streptomyces sp. TRM75563]
MTTPSSGDVPQHADSRNDFSCTSHGPVVQAATIHGGITFQVRSAAGERAAPNEIPF